MKILQIGDSILADHSWYCWLPVSLVITPKSKEGCTEVFK
jgi:hypothetical protein